MYLSFESVADSQHTLPSETARWKLDLLSMAPPLCSGICPKTCSQEAVQRLSQGCPLESAYCLKVRLDFASRLKPSWESASGRASQMFEKFGEENGCFHFTFSRFFDDEAAQPRGGSWNLESAIVLEPFARAMSVTTRAGSADATSPDVRPAVPSAGGCREPVSHRPSVPA